MRYTDNDDETEFDKNYVEYAEPTIRAGTLLVAGLLIAAVLFILPWVIKCIAVACQ